MTRTKNFADVIRAKMAADHDLAEAIELEEFHANLAQEIYDARITAKLTQKQLAERVGTTQSVIARMEDTEYNGHSLSLLRRIAKAVGKEFHAGFSVIRDRIPVTKAKRKQRIKGTSVRPVSR